MVLKYPVTFQARGRSSPLPFESPKIGHASLRSCYLLWQEAGEANMVRSEEEDLLNHEVVSAGSWILRCHEHIARQATYDGATLEELLLKVNTPPLRK